MDEKWKVQNGKSCLNIQVTVNLKIKGNLALKVTDEKVYKVKDK